MKTNIQIVILLVLLSFFSNEALSYEKSILDLTIELFTSDTSKLSNHKNFVGNVKDIDGNEYPTIKLGDQIWMAENLRTTRYNDGKEIEKPINDILWKYSTGGSYAWYLNDDTTYRNFGVLYNWLAVETGKLCPLGWHVPSDKEWDILEYFLKKNGYNYDKSKEFDRFAKSLTLEQEWIKSYQMKGSVGNDDYPKSRNKSGFSALPAGMRKSDGRFIGLNYVAIWWTSTENYLLYEYKNNPNCAIARELYYSLYFMERIDSSLKTSGYSVRCLKDSKKEK